jgi:hypothetical protein
VPLFDLVLIAASCNVEIVTQLERDNQEFKGRQEEAGRRILNAKQIRVT